MSTNNEREGVRGNLSSLKLDSLSADRLNAVSQSYFQAAREGNLKRLAEVLAPEYHFIDEHGKMFAAGACSASLEETVSNPDPTQFFRRDKIQVNSFNVEEVKMQRTGDIVIETMRYTDNISVQPSNSRELVTFDRNLRWTNIWAQRDGTFKVVLTQVTSLDTGKEFGGSGGRGGGTASVRTSNQTLLTVWAVIATILVIVLGVILILRSAG